MKTKITFFRFVSFLLLGTIWYFIPQTGFAQQQTVIPLDTLHWEKISCGSWQTSGDSLIVAGTDYRIAGVVETKDFFDLSNSEVYIKWKVNSAGQFMAATLIAGGYSLGKLATTNHSYSGSLLINENQWYYTEVKFHPDTSFTAIRSTGDFYDNGGTLLDSLRQEVTPKRWALGVKNAKIMGMIHDNYGGDLCSLTLGYVLLKNATKLTPATISDSKTFDFEDGKIPAEIKQDTNSNWIIADTGFQSNKSIFLEQLPGNSSWFEMNVTHATKVSFDARYVSGYTWNAIMSAAFAMDTLNMVTFDRSNKGCWHHFEWLLPDTKTHNLRWYSSYSGSYPQANSKLWVDNITVYYTGTTGISSPIDNDIVSVQSFPNPFWGNTTIEYKLSRPSFVRVEIYNLTGQRLKLLRSGNYTTGTHRIHWDASGLSGGTYFCRITTDKGIVMKKLILNR